MGSSSSNERSRPEYNSLPRQQYQLSSAQVDTMNRLYAARIRPDLGLLPYQMPRMAADKPPEPKTKRTQRFKNSVNIKSKTLSLQNKEDGNYAICFEYDSLETIMDIHCYFCVAEIEDAHGVTVRFESHLSEFCWKFEMPTGSNMQACTPFTINLVENIDKIGYTQGLLYYPFVIEARPRFLGDQHQENVINCQTTYCKFHKFTDNTYTIKAINQKIKAYDANQKIFRSWKLRPIYGIDGENESGNSECVICFSAQRDTLIFPCGHLSMCSACVNRLRADSSQPKCPVCRTPISRVLCLKERSAQQAENQSSLNETS